MSPLRQSRLAMQRAHRSRQHCLRSPDGSVHEALLGCDGSPQRRPLRPSFVACSSSWLHSPLRVVDSRGVRRDAEWGCGVFSLHCSCGEQIYLIVRQMAFQNDIAPQISRHEHRCPSPRRRNPERLVRKNVAGRCRAAGSTAARKIGHRGRRSGSNPILWPGAGARIPVFAPRHLTSGGRQILLFDADQPILLVRYSTVERQFKPR